MMVMNAPYCGTIYLSGRPNVLTNGWPAERPANKTQPPSFTKFGLRRGVVGEWSGRSVDRSFVRSSDNTYRTIPCSHSKGLKTAPMLKRLPML